MGKNTNKPAAPKSAAKKPAAKKPVSAAKAVTVSTVLPDPPAEVIIADLSPEGAAFERMGENMSEGNDEPTEHEYAAAIEQVLTATPTLRKDTTPEQREFIANKVQAITTRAALLSIYGDSSVVSAFGRQLAYRVKPELTKADAAPVVTDGDTMVFCALCSRSVLASSTIIASGNRVCTDTVACKKAKGDPKLQTQRIVTAQADKAAQKTTAGTKTTTSGRSWPWSDTCIVVVVNAAHGRTGVRADIFGQICVEQTVAELKVKTFEQRGGKHKMPVNDVIAAIKSGYVKVLEPVAAEAYKAEVAATAALLAKQGHVTEADKTA